MKKRTLRKVINQGWQLGKYRIPKSHHKIFVKGLEPYLEYVSKNLTVIDDHGNKTWIKNK